MDNLKNQQHRSTTARNYYGRWKNFNQFLVRLDELPKSWEERVLLYITFLVKHGAQSATVKSYISAIKAVLANDGYEWSDSTAKLKALTRACRLSNDVVKIRLPIRCGLLELLLFETERRLSTNQYLELMYKAMFLLFYYGLMRIGELARGCHTVQAKDIYISKEKRKIMLCLRSSKTHGKESKPQQIKIEGDLIKTNTQDHFDPYDVVNDYLEVRGDYLKPEDPLFVLRDGITPIDPAHVRKFLRESLAAIKLNPSLYDTHSFRIGRATDMLRMGYTIETIKQMGRWCSNAVYKYLKYV